MTLQELTGQESGIIVYPDDAVAVCNWSSLSDASTPVFDPWGMMIGLPASELKGDEDDEELRSVLYAGEVDDLRTLLPGSYYIYDDDGELVVTTDMDVIYDANDDLPTLWQYEDGDGEDDLLPTSAAYYKVGDLIIIAPDGWC